MIQLMGKQKVAQIKVNTVSSTNDLCKDLVREGFAPPFSVLAETQTRGRGTSGRQWVSNSEDGLYLSLCVGPEGFDWQQLKATHLIVAGRAKIVVERITQLPVDIKPVNDLMIKGRKVGGILLETVSKAGKKQPDYVIIGLGLNVNQASFPESIAGVATSLRLAAQRVFDKQQIADELIEELVHVFTRD